MVHGCARALAAASASQAPQARAAFSVWVFLWGTSPSAAGMYRWYVQAQCTMAIKTALATALFVRPAAELGMRSWLTLN